MCTAEGFGIYSRPMMYNLVIRKCTSPPFLAPRLKIFKWKFTTPLGIEPRTCWIRGRHATIWASTAKKCPVSDLKFPPDLKMAIYLILRETYLYLAIWDSTGGSSAQMRRIWVAGIHTVSLPPCHLKPRTLWSPGRAYVASLQSTVPVNLNSKWFVLLVKVVYLLVASFVMEKMKGIHMMRAINWK